MTKTATHLARAGLAAKGVLYALLSVLAIRIAAGSTKADADTQGALRGLAGEPLGSVVLTLLALGFAVYAGWQWWVVATRAGTRRRAAAAARGVIWSSLAVSAARFLFRAGSKANQEQSMTARLLDTTPGPWLLGALGVVIIVAGVAFLRHIKDHRYMDHLCPLPKTTTRAVKAVTITGITAKAATYALVGAFLIRAAIRHRADSGVGLDGALSQVAMEPYGTYMLAGVATGFAAYAVWCWVRARYEDVRASSG